MNRIFNKLNGILLTGFLGGILVVGLGSGIAFAEYMGFEYLENPDSTEGQLAVEEFTYEMSPGESVLVPDAHEIIFDESVPAGTLNVAMEYNPLAFAVDRDIYESETPTGIVTVIGTYWYPIVDDFELFMANKDAILQGLKENKLVGVNFDHFFTTTVTGNPADQDRVFTDYDSAARALADKSGA